MQIEPYSGFIDSILGKAQASEASKPLGNSAEDAADSGLGRIYGKWGDGAVAGFQAVPDLLFKNQKALGISATELVVLLNILMHWWYPGQKPFPRPTTIASRMGIAVRTVQRAISRLEEIGLLVRVKNEGGATALDPDPLVDKLSVLAKTDKDFLARTRGQKAA